MVLITTFVVFGVLGAVIGLLGVSVAEQAQAKRKAKARALAMGAWTLAKHKIAEEGAAWAGVEEKALGEGTISVRLQPGSAPGRLEVKAVGVVSGGRWKTTALLTATVERIEGEPPGKKRLRILRVEFR
jgi:hypothetical protein